jgi:hypothetical protein
MARPVTLMAEYYRASGRERSLHATTGVPLPFQGNDCPVRDGNTTNNNTKQSCNVPNKSTTANKGTLENSGVLVGCSSLDAGKNELGLLGPVPQSTNNGFFPTTNTAGMCFLVYYGKVWWSKTSPPGCFGVGYRWYC